MGLFGGGSLFNPTFWESLFLLAQNGAGDAGGGGGAGGIGIWPAVIASLVAMYLIMIRPERKREKELQSKLEALKKNDRVVTVAGIYGVVTNVRREADEVTLKIDEDTNTKIRCTLRSIARVIEPADEEAKT